MTALATDPTCTQHDTGAGHPESPRRYAAVAKALEAAGLTAQMQPLAPVLPTRDDLLTVVVPVLVVFAGTCVGAFGLLCAGFALHWIAPPSDQRLGNYIVDWDAIVYPLAVNALGIVVVALLSGYLAERLRRTGGALAEATERAETAERLAMLGRLAAGLAHEIRNPLGSISGSIELLREAPGLGDEDKQLCDIIQREAAGEKQDISLLFVHAQDHLMTAIAEKTLISHMIDMEKTIRDLTRRLEASK